MDTLRILGVIGGGILGLVFVTLFYDIGFSFWPALGMSVLAVAGINLVAMSYAR